MDSNCLVTIHEWSSKQHVTKIKRDTNGDLKRTKMKQLSEYKGQHIDRALGYILHNCTAFQHQLLCKVCTDIFLSYYFNFACFTIEARWKYLQYMLQNNKKLVSGKCLSNMMEDAEWDESKWISEELWTCTHFFVKLLEKQYCLGGQIDANEAHTDL